MINPLQQTQLPKSDELLTTKLTIPRLRAPLITRTALLARLDEGLDRKLTLLSAPAGFGKTTLASQWFATSQQTRHQNHQPKQTVLSRAWVALDAGDNDPVRFWRYVFRACQAFDATLGQSALALLATPQPAFEAALTTFINEMALLEDRHVLVLEDYHLIASWQIHEMVLFLLDHLPDSLHLMILTRQDPPLPLARLRTRHELNEIGATELRFSLAETQALLQQALQTPLSPEVIAGLEARTEGWVAALRLVVLALQGRRQRVEIELFLANFSGGHGHILEYLVEEVLNAQTDEIQAFLLHTTFLNRLTGSLCNAVTGRNDSTLLLEQMERANLFLISLDGIQRWYRYHGLFAEAMHLTARNRLGEAAINALHQRASLWYEEHELLGEAFETALATQDFVRAANLMEQIVAPLLVQNQFHTLRRWLDQLPKAVMRQHPQLCLTFAISILFTSDRYAPQTHELLQPPLQMAEEIWRAEGKQEKLGELLAFRSLVSWFQPNLMQAIAEAREALTLLPEENAQWRGISLILVGLDEMLKGKLHVARQELHLALELNKKAHNIYGTLDSLLLLASVCYERGELRQAAHYYELVLAEIERKPMDREMAEFRKGRAWAGQSQLQLQWNQLDQAEALATQAVTVANTYAEEELRVQGTLLLAQAEGVQAGCHQAQERLLILVTQTEKPHLLRTIENAKARLALIGGDLTTVHRWSAAANPYAPLLQREAETLLTARVQLAQGQAEATLLSLDQVDVNAKEDGRGHNLLESLVLTALAAHALKDLPRAKAALVQALRLAQPEGYQRLFLEAGETMAELLRGLLRELKEEALVIYVRTLLLALAEEKQTEVVTPSVDAALLVEPLSVQERRVLRLLAADLSNPEIASELVVSLNTVKTHVKNIYSKLDVHSREEAADLARQLNLV